MKTKGFPNKVPEFQYDIGLKFLSLKGPEIIWMTEKMDIHILALDLKKKYLFFIFPIQFPKKDSMKLNFKMRTIQTILSFTFNTVTKILIWLGMLRIYFKHFSQSVGNSLGWISSTCPKKNDKKLSNLKVLPSYKVTNYL